jgi:hypothetical protein
MNKPRRRRPSPLPRKTGGCPQAGAVYKLAYPPPLDRPGIATPSVWAIIAVPAICFPKLRGITIPRFGRSLFHAAAPLQSDGSRVSSFLSPPYRIDMPGVAIPFGAARCARAVPA